jgi:hypothetical protein
LGGPPFLKIDAPKTQVALMAKEKVLTEYQPAKQLNVSRPIKF